MYGLIGAGFDSDAGCGFTAAVCSDATYLGASAGASGVEAAAAGGTSGLGSVRGGDTCGGSGLEEGFGSAPPFLAASGSAVKTWPHREHLKVGPSAGRTRSSMR